MIGERRKLQRFELSAPTHVFTYRGDLDVERVIQTHTRDLSAFGAFVFVAETPEVGTRLRLDVELHIDLLPVTVNVPEKVKISGKGRVVRQSNDGVGVRFDTQLAFSPPRTTEGEETDG